MRLARCHVNGSKIKHHVIHFDCPWVGRDTMKHALLRTLEFLFGVPSYRLLLFLSISQPVTFNRIEEMI